MCSAVGPLAEDPGNCRPAGGNRSLATGKTECLSCSGTESSLARFFLPELCFIQLGSRAASTPSLGRASRVLQRSGQQRLGVVCGTRLKGEASAGHQGLGVQRFTASSTSSPQSPPPQEEEETLQPPQWAMLNGVLTLLMVVSFL